MRIAYLGPAGTFSEEAARAYASEGDELMPFASFPALVSAVETGICEATVLPIENSLEGTVATTVDLLIHETDLKICREINVPVRHCLVGAPGAAITDIQVVRSHPQAIGQSRRFLERCLPNAHESAALSTAGAVAEVAQSDDRTIAAIGPLRAAELYGGTILARNIEDNHQNVTRFVALHERDAPLTGNDKTSLAVSVRRNTPGSLHAVLDELAADGIQMTKLESRPAKNVLGEYYFLVDFEGHRLDPRIGATLERIRAKSDVMKIFGSYPIFNPS